MADDPISPPSAPTAATGGTPPPRPGDPIPPGGLDPTQVFAAPPVPPPTYAPYGDFAEAPPDSQAPVSGQPGQTAPPPPPPQDSGKPPPPPGTPVVADDLKKQGYDDEDIRILGIVGNYRFGSISIALTTDNIAVPAHPETRFDEQTFLKLLSGSISLMRDEKWRIIQAIPKLSQFQIDELFKILREEKKKFSELSPKHLLQLQKLEQKHSEEWRDLQSMMVQQEVKRKDAVEAQEIRKKLGL